MPSSPTLAASPRCKNPCKASTLAEIRSKGFPRVPKNWSGWTCGIQTASCGLAEATCRCWCTSAIILTVETKASLAAKAATYDEAGDLDPGDGASTCKDPATVPGKHAPLTKQPHRRRHLQPVLRLKTQQTSQHAPMPMLGLGPEAPAVAGTRATKAITPTAGGAVLPPRVLGGLAEKSAMAENLG